MRTECFHQTAAAAWDTLKTVDAIAQHWARVLGDALISKRAIRFYRNVFDTVVWLGKATVLAGQVARVLCTIALAYIDTYVQNCQAVEGAGVAIAPQAVAAPIPANWLTASVVGVCSALDWLDGLLLRADSRGNGRGSGRVQPRAA